MPKKKIEHKGKPKHVNEESDVDVFGKEQSENPEEEYTTVVDFEANRKYNKRLIESNWAKYEDDPAEFRGSLEKDDLPKTDDLNYLLQIASSDCAHFEFNSEKLWRKENNSVPASKIFNLDLDVLSSGLACLPFHERMGLNESELSAEDKEKFHKEAETNRKAYASLRERLMRKSEDDPKVKDVENNLRTLNESVKDKFDLGVSNKTEENESSIAAQLPAKGVKSLNEVDFSDSKGNDKLEKKKQSIFSGENDENLEDWLDSVLDD